LLLVVLVAEDEAELVVVLEMVQVTQTQVAAQEAVLLQLQVDQAL
jgi:hypothetical protein